MTSFTPMTIEDSNSRRKNSLVIGLVLFALVALFYAVTIVKLQGNIAKRMSMKSMSSQQTGQVVTSTDKKAAISKNTSTGQGN